MLEWPVRDLDSFPSKSYRLPLLRALFHHAYATLPDYVWALPLPQQSDTVLRKVAEVARSYTRRGLERLRLNPGIHAGEYAVVSAFANLGDDIEAFLQDLNADHPGDDFPAALIDPEGRRGRRPS
jgi:hypothetical protein